MSNFGALIAKLQYVKHVAFFGGTPGILYVLHTEVVFKVPVGEREAEKLLYNFVHVSRAIIWTLVHVPNFGGVAGSEDFACATPLPPPLIFKAKFKIFVTLPS